MIVGANTTARFRGVIYAQIRQSSVDRSIPDILAIPSYQILLLSRRHTCQVKDEKLKTVSVSGRQKFDHGSDRSRSVVVVQNT